MATVERVQAAQRPGAKGTPAQAGPARAELAQREAEAARRALASPAPYLEAALGARPEAPAARRVWERAATDIERYRFRHDVRDPQRAFGAEPRELAQRAAWREARRGAERSRDELTRERGQAPARDLERGLG